MKSKVLFRPIFFCLLLGIIFWNVGSAVFFQKDKYFTYTFSQSFINLKNVYLQSQYVNRYPKGWIPDETVNAYAGWEYVHGTPPQFVAPDTPPLGRYLIGLSEIIFNNENIVVIVTFVLSLILMYAIGIQIFLDPLLALVPIAGISTEPIMLNQLVYTPLLDIFQLMFLLAFFLFFNKTFKQKNKVFGFLITSLFLGCFIATKFFITGVIILLAGVVVLLYNKQLKSTFVFLFTTVVSIVILLLTYIRSFAFHYTLKSFLGIQKWIFLYHKSQLILPFSIWPLLIFNKWYVWFGSTPIISDPQWRITWPIITIITLMGGGLYILKKIQRNKNVEILFVWSVGYLLFFSFGQISARYLVILLPIFYITATFSLVEVVRLKMRKEKPKKKIKK